ncbi:MAG: molecular chaperone HtpG [Firmicutes bacterium]|nr:molecular chaperone HtpG [Bacillota bacterium]
MGKKQFKAESRRLLDLMVNSIYTNKEIFLREIISNASDAIDKLCYMALTDSTVGLKRDDFQIKISIDKENRTLTVSDNGIGMNAEELEHNLGTIAFSGSSEFKEKLGAEKPEDAPADAAVDTDIIGQFGVGFYSAFMVADHIDVVSRRFGEETAHKWSSDGADGFTVTEAERAEQGTDVIMHIRPDGEEKDEFSQYVREYPIYKLVKKYSDYVRFPIRMLLPRPHELPDSTPEEPKFDEVFELETLNSMVPIWKRRKSEVTKEEYDRFYSETYSDPEAPQSCLPVSVDGNISYDALVYIPSKAPADYFTDDFRPGLQLYSSGILIMDRCEDLLPDYFNFVRGVVDSPDLSLNISRELLQHDRQLKLIGSHLEKKVRAELERMLKDDREGYEKFFKNFGRQLKLCALEEYGAKKDELQDLLMFWSSTEKKQVLLEEYFSRMKEDQKYIYYATGETIEAVDRLPQNEVLKDGGYEILYLTDKMDEFVLDMFRNYKDKPFRSAQDGDLGIETGKKDGAELAQGALDFIKKSLGDRVDEVVASTKLKSHPVFLSSGDGISFEMERYFKAVGQEMPIKAKRILEINTDHQAFRKIDSLMTTDPDKAAKYAEVLYNQALLIAGMPIDDPSGYTDLVCSLF